MSTPEPVLLANYTAPQFWVDTVDLTVSIHADHTDVEAVMSVRRRNPHDAAPLILDGRELELLSVAVDGTPVADADYQQTDETLSLNTVPSAATITVRTRIHPASNTSLEGLYKADSAYCTQCEAQGFRKITYFPDRPDVMATYSTTIEADRTSCPTLLSNGNAVASGELDNNRHWVRWEDPFPKPSYLFALVAGDLASVEDQFRTASGRNVALKIYVEHHNVDKCAHAMASLKHAMRWDEEVYGLEYDLDIYMIVAVDDFNMGAMENKGLNVFNSKYVLAQPETATDDDFAGIESVIAHEYFHNWTGNRVTCRDWFQLSLKEGLTVFRDQEFSADMGSRAVKRIQDVRILRAAQFAEDAGPMAHPVRPSQYVEINNFYTVTIYNKGAELIRMMHTLIGAQAFRHGMDLYFERHDGQAVTTDDFVQAMQDASGHDLTQFKRWYAQAGTPELRFEEHWDAQAQELTLTFAQQTPDTPGQQHKTPMPIPIRLGVVSDDDAPGTFTASGMGARHEPSGDVLVELTQERDTVRLQGLTTRPTASVLRDFSAPVKLLAERDEATLAHLFARDQDPFNRWDASQSLVLNVITKNIERFRDELAFELPPGLTEAFTATLKDHSLDPAFVAETLLLPGENYIADQLERIDVDAVHATTAWFRQALAMALRGPLLQTYRNNRSNEPYSPDGASAGRRALKNAALGLLVGLDDTETRALALEQYHQADNMTDSIAALRALVHTSSPERQTVLDDFESRWRGESLVMDKWFGVQAAARTTDALDDVRRLEGHSEFDLRKPNKVRALLGMFALGNPRAFHAADGSGYTFVAEHIQALDDLNPQVAARLVTAFSRWARIDGHRGELMQAALRDILGHAGLSKDVTEMVSRTLGDSA